MTSWPGIAASSVAVALFGVGQPVAAQGDREPDLATSPQLHLSAPQMFERAEAALARKDPKVAEAAWRALMNDPDLHVRIEARFRLGMMYASLLRYSEAAMLFRQILDQQPGAQRVRLELARVLDLMGDESGARRALREAQAGGLPPDVARFVDRYSAALRSRKPLGASIELAIAPDTNVNRATRSNTLGTVLGDFTLNDDAQEKSGVGAALSAQAYARHNISDNVTLIARGAASADLYRESDFNDVSLGAAVGPEMRFGGDRIALEAGRSWRWYGGRPYSATNTIGISYFHPIDRQSQLRAVATLGDIGNKRNSLQDGQSYTLSLSYERAVSHRAGLGLSVVVDRQDARDPGYAATSGQVSVLGYREIGAATVVATLSYGRLEADARQFIFPRRRVDDLYRLSIGATFRQLAVGGFAPLVRVIAERNRSGVELYDYRRLRAEFGVTRAF